MPLELPARGRDWESLAAEMSAMREHDLDWRRGRHGAYVWYADDALEDVLREAYGMFMVENGLGLRVFHSIQRMESEVLSMVAELLHGDDEAAGIFTSGGTESIFQAIYAAREWARETRPGVTAPEFVAPHSAHPALNKAAHLLGMRVRRVPVGADFHADPEAIERAIGLETIGLYASAPTYSLGMVDPVPELAAIAQRHGLWLHVDACVGGILAPAVREIGYDVPSFDFANEGVTSISADLHKSGYAAKPASTVTFRTAALQKCARFRFDDWPSGMYTSLTFTGSRPGGAIAAAWAAMQYLGRPGYRRIAESSMRTKEAIIAGVTATAGARIHGAPELWPFAFAIEGVDPAALAGALMQRGWVAGVTTSPPGIHVMPTPVHEPYVAEYVSAVAESAAQVRAGSNAPSKAAAYN